MYKVQNKLAPAHNKNLFTHVSDIHSYSTRWSATTNKSCVMSFRLDQLKNLFSRFGVRLWNALPGNIKKFASRNLLRNKIQGVYMKLFKQEHFVPYNVFYSWNN